MGHSVGGQSVAPGDDLATWLDDQRALARSDRVDYMEGFFASTVQGLRNEGEARRPFVHWYYGLHLSFEHERGNAPDATAALQGLRPYRLLHKEDQETPRFAALPTGIPAGAVEDALRAVRAAHQMLIAAGGKRYLPGWLAMMDAGAWRAHYGDGYTDWLEAKKRYDPRGVFRSALFPESG